MLQERMPQINLTSSLASFVHERFTLQAQQTPHAPALRHAEQNMTYAELDARSNQLANYLRQAGIGAEQRVGLFLERSPLMIVALLGVLKAGAAYVPFDPQQPGARLQTVMDDAELSMVLSQNILKAQLPTQPIPTLLLDADPAPFARSSSAAPAVSVNRDQLAYMIYTSGSTGQPKGVLVTHRGIMNLIDSQITAFELTPASRVLQFAPLNFDASVSEIWTTLLAGATLYLVDASAVLPGADLRRALQDNAISVVTLPPSVLTILEPDDYPALQTVVSAGEMCSLELVARWGRQRRFINAYGPTEVTVCATMAPRVLDQDQVSIGAPIANTTIYLVDEEFQLIEAVDVVGEMLISSPGVARGYHNQPALTAERFLDDPFDRDSPYQVYRTGDLARWLPDGTLEFVGRRDNQIKLRGFRIEPGEIESLLRQYPGVRQAVVTARQDPSGNPRLVAYVLADAGVELSISGLRSYAKAVFPNYMIPSAFVPVTHFDLTSSGKVNLAALPEPNFNAIQRDTAFVAPQTELETTIAAIWEEVLGVAAIGINDNFFDIGGHSLLATRVISLIRQRLSIEIPLSALLSVEPTIAATARIVEEYLLNLTHPLELLALLEELDGLSDEEVHQLLENAQGAAW